MPTLDYLDFELSIGHSDAGVFPLTVLHSPAGEATASLQLPWPNAHPSALLAELQEAILSAASTDGAALVREFGETLFRALFRDDVGACYDASKAAARAQGKGLRLKLRIEPLALLALPWEALYDPRAAEYVCLSRYTPLVRYLAVRQPGHPLAVQPPLRILAMAANPAGTPELDIRQEKVRLGQALAALRERGQVELVWLAGQNWRDLQEALQTGPWHIFHFVGHAIFDATAGEGALLLSDHQGDAQALRATEFARLLDDQPALRLAVLNACESAAGDEQNAFSSLAAALVRRGLPAVIAMQTAITDQAAVEFSRSFYGALSNGLPIDAATGEARKAMSLVRANSLEWVTPVLHMRAPDGRLWETPATTATTRAPSGGGATSPTPRSEPTLNANIHIGGNASNSLFITGSGNTVNASPPAQAGSITAAEQAQIEEQVSQLLFALRTLRGQLDAARLQMAELQLKLLQNELVKPQAAGGPDGATIMLVGDWLHENMPGLAEPLARFFATPAVSAVLTRAGAPVVQWAQRTWRM